MAHLRKDFYKDFRFINFTEKYIAKSFLAALSIILFVVLAFSSAQVEILTCTSTACTTQNLFYEENIWFFWGMSMFSAVMLIVYVFLAISVALTGEKGELEGNPKDIGKLLEELNRDFVEECKPEL
ncbi:hypothetical protein LCGC14_2852990, partial [marine sediment metagenome]